MAICLIQCLWEVVQHALNTCRQRATESVNLEDNPPNLHHNVSIHPEAQTERQCRDNLHAISSLRQRINDKLSVLFCPSPYALVRMDNRLDVLDYFFLLPALIMKRNLERGQLLEHHLDIHLQLVASWYKDIPLSKYLAMQSAMDDPIMKGHTWDGIHPQELYLSHQGRWIQWRVYRLHRIATIAIAPWNLFFMLIHRRASLNPQLQRLLSAEGSSTTRCIVRPRSGTTVYM